MRRNLYILLFLLMSALSAVAGGVKDIWISMPNQITPYLNKDLRQKLVTFNQTGVNPTVNNLIGGESKLDTLAGNFVQVELSEACTLQMKLLPRSAGDSLVCVVKTYLGPAKRSEMKFYTTDWQELDNIPLPEQSLPARPDTMDINKYNRLVRSMDGRMQYMSLHAENNILTTGFSVIFATVDEQKALKDFCKETQWTWTGEKFVVNP